MTLEYVLGAGESETARTDEGEGRWMKLKWNYPKEQTAPRVSEPDERLKRDRMDAKESFTSPPLSNYAPAELPPISGCLNGFVRARDDTFLQAKTTYNVDIYIYTHT